MNYTDILKSMSLEEIGAVVEALQTASDSYIYIFDLDADTLMLTEKTLHRFPFENIVIRKATQALQRIVYFSDYAKLEQDIVRCASGMQTIHKMEYRWLDKEGRVVWIDCRGTVIRGAGEHKLLIGRVMELGTQAKADNVTGLRREVRLRLDMEELLRDRPETIRYVMRIGIDNFKEINEKEGIEAGDDVLRELADCIVSSVDLNVDVYRLMADEFMIVDSGAGPLQDTEAVYNIIKGRVAESVRRKEYSCFYTISAGVVQDGFADKSAEDILRLTEFALNEAKRAGRNQIALFDIDKYNEYLKKLDIRKLMRRDINNGFRGFQVFFQPIVSASDYQLVGAEALLRWNCEKYGNVPPGEFIPILEESGLIIPVGSYVLWEAARTCKKWRAQLSDFHVNINLSYVQMHKSDLLQDVDRCIREVGIPPESLVLELTESGYIETDSRMKEMFKSLKEKKVDLALDDFGTGYSNMRYLKEIEATTVKLDRSFVVQALKDEHDYNIISHIIDMVHGLGFFVCMEGIEEKDELNKMLRTKPDMIQGYYFGKPSPAWQFEEQFIRS